jgi:hypothetical protein
VGSDRTQPRGRRDLTTAATTGDHTGDGRTSARGGGRVGAWLRRSVRGGASTQHRTHEGPSSLASAAGAGGFRCVRGCAARQRGRAVDDVAEKITQRRNLESWPSVVHAGRRAGRPRAHGPTREGSHAQGRPVRCGNGGRAVGIEYQCVTHGDVVARGDESEIPPGCPLCAADLRLWIATSLTNEDAVRRCGDDERHPCFRTEREARSYMEDWRRRTAMFER